MSKPDSTNQRVLDILDKLTPASGTFINREVAEDVLIYLNQNDPTLLRDWLNEQAISLFTTHLAAVQLSRRHHILRTQRRSTNQTLMNKGVSAGLSIFDQPMAVDDDHNRLRLGEWTGKEHMYVSQKFRKSGNFDLLNAEFHKLIAEKVGTHRTDEVYTETEYLALFKQEVGQHA